MSDKNQPELTEAGSTISLSRRQVLLGAAAVAATATAGSSSAFAAMEHDHSHHMMNNNEAAIDAALGCLKKGQACLDHCIELFKTGDTSVAKCADTVSEMLAMCTALSQMASYNSKHLAKVAGVCRQVCLDCEKECRKHEDKHAACKACAESCERCAAECKKLAA
jgi:Cys-rich four helix bundle protein (predicted Tat secretion target)